MAIYRDKRSLRHNLYQEAWITLDNGGFAKQSCAVIDLSRTGAKLRFEPGVSVPPQFHLTMSRDVRKSQLCRVVWREGGVAGVEFINTARP